MSPWVSYCFHIFRTVFYTSFQTVSVRETKSSKKSLISKSINWAKGGLNRTGNTLTISSPLNTNTKGEIAPVPHSQILVRPSRELIFTLSTFQFPCHGSVSGVQWGNDLPLSSGSNEIMRERSGANETLLFPKLHLLECVCVWGGDPVRS